MNGEKRALDLMSGQNETIIARVMDSAAWHDIITADPRIPRTSDELKALIGFVHGHQAAVAEDADRTFDAATFEEDPDCLTDFEQLIHAGFGNPDLTDEEIDELDQLMASMRPDFLDEHVTTEHFRCNYTLAHGEHRISTDRVRVVANQLERAYRHYTDAFGRHPYFARDKHGAVARYIEVDFWSLPATKHPDNPPKGSTSPNGPIKLNTRFLRDNPTWLWTTAVHELFHRLQFAFGWRAAGQTQPYAWFSESSASWASLWETREFVKTPQNIEYLFKDPAINTLLNARYFAVPVWVFLEMLHSAEPSVEYIRKFLDNYEAHHDLDYCYRQMWSPVVHAMFGVGMFWGFWRSVGSSFPFKLGRAQVRYPCIYAIETGTPVLIEPAVKEVTADALLSTQGLEGQATIANGGIQLYLFRMQQALIGKRLVATFESATDVKLTLGILSLRQNEEIGGYSYVTPQQKHLRYETIIERRYEHITFALVADDLDANTEITWSVLIK